MKTELTSTQLDKLTEIQFLDSFEECQQAIDKLCVSELFELSAQCQALADKQMAIAEYIAERLQSPVLPAEPSEAEGSTK
jgi:hypothetical protein